MCELTLTSGDVSVSASASDYFDAFCGIREELEKIGLTPVCYGASRHVWPSGMCRDMGLGLKAYNGGIGERQSPPDLVGIFETGPDVAPVSVQEQRAYAEAALAAFKRQSVRRLR